LRKTTARPPVSPDACAERAAPRRASKRFGEFLEVRLVFGDGFGRTLEFQEHVREHFAGGDADGFAATLVLMVGAGAQFCESFVGFSFGEGQPRFASLRSTAFSLDTV